MKLTIVTPLAVVVDEDDVQSLAAEDASGSFGVMPGHADFVTALAVSVVSWKAHDGTWHHCAVRGGSLSAGEGAVVVTSREAVASDDLDTLDRDVLNRFQAEADAERIEHVDQTRMQLAAIRQIVRNLDGGGRAGAP